MVGIETDYLKEKVENRLREEHQNRNRREDLYELDQQITGQIGRASCRERV